MRIEEVFSYFNQALYSFSLQYNIVEYLDTLTYNVYESDKPDILVTDLPSRIAERIKELNLLNKNISSDIITIAKIISNNLQFNNTVTKHGDLEFYLWQEVQ